MASAKLEKLLDAEFRLYILNRDSWRCCNPFCRRDCYYNRDLLTCSHFLNRWRHSVRWDGDNCDALCGECHTKFENAKFGWVDGFCYDYFKQIQLGNDRYNNLLIRGNTVLKLTDPQILEFIKATRAATKELTH